MTSHPHRSKAAQHTATLKPWSYHEINYVRGAIHDAAGIDIVEHVTREIGEEILHAVNRAALFDELVAALKKATETLWSHGANVSARNAEAVLAKIGEK